MPVDDNLYNKLNTLKTAYLQSMKGKIIELKELAAKEAAVKEVFFIVHKIAGTSGVYGLSELSSLSNEFEIYLKELKNNTNLINNEDFSQKFGNYINNIEKIVSEG